MSSIILQPAGNKGSRINYTNTIENLVSQEKIKKHVDEFLYQQIKEIYQDNPIPVWGVTPGKNDVNIGKWKRVKQGDITLFSRNGIIFSTGSITIKFRNKELAKSLWGEDETGQTWEYIYFLDEMKTQNITYLEFNRAVGYKENFVIQGFNVLDDQKSNRLINTFDLLSTTYFPDVEQGIFEKEIKKFDEDRGLDKNSIGTSRVEQQYLRKTLFGASKVNKCGICHKKYPISFLVAAHIKKRAHCSFEEKVDVENIVMPMCKFGCDELFERGYISVQEGKVIKNDNLVTTPVLENYIKNIEHNKVYNWNMGTKEYFEWHYNYHNNN